MMSSQSAKESNHVPKVAKAMQTFDAFAAAAGTRRRTALSKSSNAFVASTIETCPDSFCGHCLFGSESAAVNEG